jgi:hypothetical protein
MLVGPRFPAEISDAKILEMTRDGQIHSSPFERQLPEPIASIVRRAIEIEPTRRYPHAGIFADDLRRACTPMGVGDGRVYLRQALEEMFRDEQLVDEEPTLDYAQLRESISAEDTNYGYDSGARLTHAEKVDEDD